jgi:hypothetical protein
MNTRTPIVWITMTEKTKDFSDARKYGELRVVFPRSIQEHDNDPVGVARREMREYQDGDFILTSGDPMACGIVMETAMGLSDSQVLNVLRWDRRTLRYAPFELNFT